MPVARNAGRGWEHGFVTVTYVVYLGRLVITDPAVTDKLHRKHDITYEDVVEALQHPAQARAAWDDDPYYGPRVIALGSVADGREVIGYLKALPEWDDHADTWDIKTARWVK